MILCSLSSEGQVRRLYVPDVFVNGIDCIQISTCTCTCASLCHLVHPYDSTQRSLIQALLRILLGCVFSSKVQTVLHEVSLSNVSSFLALSLALLLEVPVLCTEVGHRSVTELACSALALLVDDAGLCYGTISSRSAALVIELQVTFGNVLIGVKDLLCPRLLLMRFHVDVGASQGLRSTMYQNRLRVMAVRIRDGATHL